MLNNRWIKNEAGCLLAVWAPREPGKPVVPLGTDSAISPARSHSGFHRADCRCLRKAA